jgi:dethiobiotin synthetase
MIPLKPYSRPALFITGIGTEVGKTVATAALAGALHSLGVRVGLLKPIAAGCPKYPHKGNHPNHELKDEDLIPMDSLLPAAAGNVDTTNILKFLSPIRYAAPMSPHIAAQLENRPVDWSRVAAALEYWADHCDLLLIEGAGGWLTPLDQDDHTIADLAVAVQAPVILVTTATLGSINATLLNVESIRARQLKVEGLVINRVPAESKQDLSVLSNMQEIPRLANAPLLATLPELLKPPEDDVPQSLIDAMLPYARDLGARRRA